MADRTIKFDIKAAVDTRGLDEFQSQLGELRSIAEPLDRVLGEAVKSIQDWAAASRLSERNTAAATSAVNALKSAMTAGGNEWKKAAQAGNELNRTLRETVNAANAAKAALAAPSRTTVGASQQIADMRKGLQELTIGSSQYLKLLEQITEREALLGRRTGRAGVVAANQAYEGALLNRGYGAADRLQEMPDTTAALQQRKSEIAASLPNLLRGTEDYLRAAREMRQIERELARDISRSTEESNALAAARKRLAAATQASSASARSGFAAFSSGIGDNLAVQRSIERNRIKQEQQFVAGLPAGAVLSQGYGAPIGPEVSAQSASALQQRYQDLSQSLGNVTRGSESYLRIAGEMRSIERQLSQDVTRSTQEANALAAARKRLAEATSLNRSSNSSGFAAFSRTVNDRIDVNNSIDQYRQQQGLPIGFRSGAAQFTQGQNNVLLGPAAPTELLRSIDGITTSGATAKLQTLGRSYGEVAQQIRETAQAAGGSTRALQAERQAWEQLQGAVAPATREYRKAEREINRVDRKLGSSRRGERFLESAGAISAGAFFGGPEGFVGGLVGMAIGGPGAALGGASIGANLGIVRKAIGDSATYSASLDKLRIALAGVTGGGNEYSKALDAVSGASDNLNIRQEDSLRGFTRLSASVIAAGGSVNEAKNVFDGVNAAIKASGGSSEEAQAALLALSQVFSKGKVSAEELSGQLGERLPGAVALFAKATGRTLPQLNKDLKDGIVGLNDVLKFTEALGEKYGPVASRIAKSSEEAGARSSVAWDKFRETIGRVFQPLGAQLQDSSTQFLNWATSVIKAAAGVNEELIKIRVPSLQFNGRTYEQEAQRLITGARQRTSNGGLRNFSNFVEITYGGQVYSGSPDEVRKQLAQNLLLRAQNQERNNKPKPLNFPDPSSGKAEEDAAKKAEREKRKEEERQSQAQRLAMQIYNDQVRYDEQIAENKIRLADQVFQHEQELMRQRADMQRKLDDLRQQTLVASLSPEGRNASGPILELLQRLQGNSDEIRQLKEAVSSAERAVKSAEESAKNRERFGAMYQQEGVGGGLIGNMLPGTKGGPNINEGVGYGRGRLHAGQDLGLDIGDPIHARRSGVIEQAYSTGFGKVGGAVVVRYDDGMQGVYGHTTPLGGLRPGMQIAAGQRIATVAPDGSNTHLHYELRDQIGKLLQPLKWINESLRSQTAPATTVLANNREVRVTGQASAQLRAAGATGDVEQAKAGLDAARKQLAAAQGGTAEFNAAAAKLSITQLIQPLRDQQLAVRDNYQEWQTRNRLQLEGVAPELIDFEVRKTRILNEQARAEIGLNEVLSRNKEKLVAALGSEEAYNKAVNDLKQERKDLTLEQIRLEQQLAEAQADPQLALQRKIFALNQSLRDFNDSQKLAIGLSDQFSSNLANGFSGAVSSIVTGSGTIQQSLASMFENISKMFLDTIARILADQAASYILSLFGKPLSPFSAALPMLGGAGGITGGFGFGDLGGSVAGNFAAGLPTLAPAVGFAKGGISTGTTAGYPVTLHGTEAVVPLPNGRAIPVEMTGGSGTSVVVNVNMSTGQADVNSGERDGQLLGQALSEAVQAELVRQKRPGGILYR